MCNQDGTLSRYTFRDAPCATPEVDDASEVILEALEPKKVRLVRAAVMNLPIETLRG